jgi:hypothetical protein
VMDRTIFIYKKNRGPSHYTLWSDKGAVYKKINQVRNLPITV